MSRIAIQGNTYPVKEKLKELGAKWNGEMKAWMIDESKAEQARQIVAQAGPPTPRKGGFAPSRCKQCGAAASRYNRIYRNGICGQCYKDDREEAEMGY